MSSACSTIDDACLLHGYLLPTSCPLEEPVVIDGIQFDYFNYLFDYLEHEFVQGVKAFEELFSANPIEDWKLDFSERIHYESCITEYITT